MQATDKAGQIRPGEEINSYFNFKNGEQYA